MRVYEPVLTVIHCCPFQGTYSLFLPGILMTGTVKRVRSGSIVYPTNDGGMIRSYFYGYMHLNIDPRYNIKQDRV
jgi:hypothetical protein